MNDLVRKCFITILGGWVEKGVCAHAHVGEV